MDATPCDSLLEKLSAWKPALAKEVSWGENPRLILIGESHWDPKMRALQLKLINELRPKTVLHEYAGAYEWKNDQWELMSGRFAEKKSHNEVLVHKELIEACVTIGAELKGCDLSEEELRAKAREFVRRWPRLYRIETFGNDLFDSVDQFSLEYIGPKKDDPGFPGNIYDPRAIILRDEKAAEVMLEQMRRRENPDEVIIAIMGGFHISNIHQRGLLRSRKIAYRGFP